MRALEAARRPIALLTDFGYQDAYAGTLSGVILSINPHARVIDLSHGVRPGDVRQAAFLLQASAGYFPPGTIYLVVVDPGVGTERKALAVRSGESCFVGPDNGVLSWSVDPASPGVRAVSVEHPGYRLGTVSATFHGRDVFAPAAAHLSLGVPVERLGPRVAEWVQLRRPRLETRGNRVEGEVVDVDRFGNLITSIPGSLLGGIRGRDLCVEVAGRRVVGQTRTYGDGPSGELITYLGSAGFLEIARVAGSARDLLGCGPGAPVALILGRTATPDDR